MAVAVVNEVRNEGSDSVNHPTEHDPKSPLVIIF